MCNFSTFAEWLLRARKRAYSASWCAEFGVWERTIGVTDVQPYEDDPAWLTLPAATKELALRRLEEMLQYEAIESPSTVQAERTAAKMSMTTGRFYQLRRRWNQSRSIFTFVPFDKTAAMSHPRLSKAVSEAVTEHLGRLIAEGMRSPAKILTALSESWYLTEPMPSHMTLRKMIAKAIDEAGSVSGNISVNNAALPQEAIEKATEFGEVLLVDHTGLEVFLVAEDEPSRIFLTLAIDLYTTTVLGYAISLLPPGPGHVVAALESAVARTSIMADEDMQPVQPRLVFAATKNAQWRQLVAKLDAVGTKASVRHTARLHFGGMIARLVGPWIGHLKLSSRRARAASAPPFDRTRDTWLTLDQITKLLDEGILALNKKRRPPDARVRALDIHLNGLLT